MVIKEYQERLVTLVKDTLTLLCKNGLEYSHEFSVEGMLGITLDKDEVFLIPIHEYVKDKIKEPEPEPIMEEPEPRTERTHKRDRKKKRRYMESTPDDECQDTGGGGEWDDNSRTLPDDTDTLPDTPAPTKRPRDNQHDRQLDFSNVKAEDIVVIKEEDDEDDYEGFQDNSLDNNTYNQTDQSGDGMPFFSQAGTSQADMNFSLEQLSGSAIPGALGNMPSEGDMSSWLQQQADGGQQGNWQAGDSSQKQQWICTLCGKAFDRQAWLKRHHDGVHLRVRFNCDLCHRSYSQKNDLRHHKCTMHTQETLK